MLSELLPKVKASHPGFDTNYGCNYNYKHGYLSYLCVFFSFFSESTVCPTGCLCYRGRPVCGFESTVAIGSTELVPPYATGISIIVPYTNGEFRSVGLFSMCGLSFLSLDMFSDATMLVCRFDSFPTFTNHFSVFPFRIISHTGWSCLAVFHCPNFLFLP